jgi:dTDP-4-dehydrorhamnose 3,5-epimerase
MPLDGVLLFLLEPCPDDRGFFAQTFDARIGRDHRLAPEEFVPDRESRSGLGSVRASLRAGRGQAKLIRCARGAVVDVRSTSRRSLQRSASTWW